MKKFFSLLISLTIICLFLTSTVTFAKMSKEETRAKLDKMSVEVLEKMYAKYPDSKSAVEKSYAYCTISASGVKWGFFGDDHGRGLAYNKETGKKIYMKMKEVSLGVNFGAKDYDLLFVIQNQTAWERFISGNIKFGSEVSAQASDGVSGDTFANATIIANGVWVYQLDKKGLAVELSLKGARISPFRTLNDKEEPDNEKESNDKKDLDDEKELNDKAEANDEKVSNDEEKSNDKDGITK